MQDFYMNENLNRHFIYGTDGKVGGRAEFGATLSSSVTRTRHHSRPPQTADGPTAKLDVIYSLRDRRRTGDRSFSKSGCRH
jgi:hypothetical protein